MDLTEGVMENVKVSIITVSYNSVRTIEQTIRSVLKQSYQNIEYIVIDGESTDGTCDIIRKYEDAIAFYMSEPDTGIYDAMNKGLQHATGDIVGIINSDDWYEPDAVGRIVECFISGEAEVVYGRVCFVDEKGICTYSRRRPLDSIWYLAGGIPHPSVFVKHCVYEKYGVFDTDYRVAADYELLLRFYTKRVQFEFVDAVISNFRLGGFSSRNYLEGNEEARRISLSYINRCSEKSYVLGQIERNYNLTRMIPMIEQKPSIICNLLKRRFHGIEEGVAVFGVGIWSERIHKLLDSEKIPIWMFVDNNKTVWNTKKRGIAVCSPRELIGYKGFVIVAVKDENREICRQLTELNNLELKWVTLDDIWEEVSGL